MWQRAKGTAEVGDGLALRASSRSHTFSGRLAGLFRFLKVGGINSQQMHLAGPAVVP